MTTPIEHAAEAMWEAIDDKGINGRLTREDCTYLAEALAAAGLIATEPTVKPGREELIAVISEVRRGMASTSQIADAVLAILPGRTEAQVRAEALRDAKTRIALDITFSGQEVAAWLDALADEEAGK